MKLCYCDESGTGREKIATMAGIIVDSHTMHKTKMYWEAILDVLRREVDWNIPEIKGSALFAGRGAWGKVSRERRYEIITNIIQLVEDRKHKVVYASVHKEIFRRKLATGQIPKNIATEWRWMGLHITLALQKFHQKQNGIKGHTMLIFDNCEKERVRFSDFIASPPDWSDVYYSKGAGPDRLDQIIDVPYFGDSKEVVLIQAADVIAFVLRLYAEMQEGYARLSHDDVRQVSIWARRIGAGSVGKNNMYKPTRGSDPKDMFFHCAPDSIRMLCGPTRAAHV